ncbi:hypothetical protein CN918_28170 [Priestia megaterium]|nr:hypothetical protein CN918_28170 [Priestia megaterium]
MKKRTLQSYTTEEKVAFFDNFYKKAAAYFEGYVDKVLDYDDEKWNMRDELMDVLADVVYPGTKERSVYRWMDDAIEGVIDVEEKEEEGYRITWYNHDWKEELDKQRVKELKNSVGGKQLVIEIAPSDEGIEYAICSGELDEGILEALRDAVTLLKKSNPASLVNCYQEGILHLECKEDVKNFLSLASEEVIQVYGHPRENEELHIPIYISREERPLEHEDNLDDIFGEVKETLKSDTKENECQDDKTQLENKVDCPWYLKSKENLYYDFVLNQFIPEKTATTALPLYELGQFMKDQLKLTDTVIVQEHSALVVL